MLTRRESGCFILSEILRRSEQILTGKVLGELEPELLQALIKILQKKKNPWSRYCIGQYSYKLIKPSRFLNNQSQFWSKLLGFDIWEDQRSKVPQNPECHQILTISSLARYQHFTKIYTKLPALLCSQITAGYHLLTTEGASGARGARPVSLISAGQHLVLLKHKPFK